MAGRWPARRPSDASLADPLHIAAFSVSFYADAALVEGALAPAQNLLGARAWRRASPPDVPQLRVCAPVPGSGRRGDPLVGMPDAAPADNSVTQKGWAPSLEGRRGASRLICHSDTKS